MVGVLIEGILYAVVAGVLFFLVYPDVNSSKAFSLVFLVIGVVLAGGRRAAWNTLRQYCKRGTMSGTSGTNEPSKQGGQETQNNGKGE